MINKARLVEILRAAVYEASKGVIRDTWTGEEDEGGAPVASKTSLYVDADIDLESMADVLLEELGR